MGKKRFIKPKRMVSETHPQDEMVQNEESDEEYRIRIKPKIRRRRMSTPTLSYERGNEWFKKTEKWLDLKSIQLQRDEDYLQRLQNEKEKISEKSEQLEMDLLKQKIDNTLVISEIESHSDSEQNKPISEQNLSLSMLTLLPEIHKLEAEEVTKTHLDELEKEISQYRKKTHQLKKEIGQRLNRRNWISHKYSNSFSSSTPSTPSPPSSPFSNNSNQQTIPHFTVSVSPFPPTFSTCPTSPHRSCPPVPPPSPARVSDMHSSEPPPFDLTRLHPFHEYLSSQNFSNNAWYSNTTSGESSLTVPDILS